MPVAKDLDLDMARARDQPLGVERAVAERARRLRLATGEGLADFAFLRDRPHAPPAAPGDCFQHDRRADRREERPRLGGVAQPGALNDRRAGARCEFARQNLVAEQVERFGRRPDEGQPGRRDRAGEGRVLGEKAIARMNGVATRLEGECDQALAVEIGGHAGATQRMRLVRLAHVQRGRVVFGIDGDAGETEIGGRARDADGDFAAIGDEQLADG